MISLLVKQGVKLHLRFRRESSNDHGSGYSGSYSTQHQRAVQLAKERGHMAVARYVEGLLDYNGIQATNQQFQSDAASRWDRETLQEPSHWRLDDEDTVFDNFIQLPESP